MCGIIGYIGKRDALPILLAGLKRLEYRGYDSAGLAVIADRGKIQSMKAVGRVRELEKKAGKLKIAASTGMAHTRWATHGHPNERNAHPHADCSEKVWVVHNGIIENHRELKRELARLGHKFRSDTDTEVISHLVEEYYAGDLADAVRKARRRLRGTYGIVVLHEDRPEQMVAAKLGSPLVVGIGKGEHIVSSDPSAVLVHTKKVVYLKDGEQALLTARRLDISNGGKIVKKEIEELDWEYAQADLGNYPDFMLKEISEQPATTSATLAGRLKNGSIKLGGLETIASSLDRIEKLYIVGCGTARLAGLIGEFLIEEFAGLDAETDYASEFKYRSMRFDKEKTAVLAISQSGETADTKAAIEKAKEEGLLTLGIVNVVGSSISRMTDAGIYTHCGPEIAVASTKAFTSQVAVLVLIAAHLGSRKPAFRKTIRPLTSELGTIPAKMKQALKSSSEIRKIAAKYKDNANFAFQGRKYNYPLAFEGALKLKEVSYIHAEGFPSGEMKHGPIAMIDSRFPSVFIAPCDSMFEKNLNNIEEVKARGGRVILITSSRGRKAAKLADDTIMIPETFEPLFPLLAAIPVQLLAYHMALAKNRDVDKPRNLAKSVTVE